MMTPLVTIGLLFSLSLALFYCAIIIAYIKGWNKTPEWKVPESCHPKTRVSIIVPARNESGNILTCLSSIANQTYPVELFEVLVIDDHSTDGTFEQVSNYSLEYNNIKALRLSDFMDGSETQSFKKKAIEMGISQATGELIVSTDADCIVQEKWLAHLISFYEKYQWRFIAAPVNFHNEKNMLEKFQSLDFLGMMGTTAGGISLGMHHMCNGANLAYPKEAFYAVGGFGGIDKIASGDDMLLMQKIAQHYPGKIGFLKSPEATVFTRAMPNLLSFVRQRIRWATKSGSYKERILRSILGIVFLYSCSILMSLALIPVLHWLAFYLFAFLLTTKAIADFFFLRMMAGYFNRKDLMKSFFPAQFMHIAYIIVAGFLGLVVKKYNWKDRRVQ